MDKLEVAVQNPAVLAVLAKAKEQGFIVYKGVRYELSKAGSAVLAASSGHGH